MGRPSTASIAVVPMPGKGLGVVARRAFQAGEWILGDTPLVQIHRDLKTGNETVESFGDWTATQARLLRLARSSIGETDFQRATHANGFVFTFPPREQPLRREVPDELAGVQRRQTIVFDSISRVNHSCDPNAAFTWYSRDQAGVIRAARPIAPGDEICINYGASGPRAVRQRTLRRCFEFDCACPLCTRELDVERATVQELRCAGARDVDPEEKARIKEERWAELERLTREHFTAVLPPPTPLKKPPQAPQMAAAVGHHLAPRTGTHARGSGTGASKQIFSLDNGSTFPSIATRKV